jgi:hypothetical protein
MSSKVDTAHTATGFCVSEMKEKQRRLATKSLGTPSEKCHGLYRQFRSAERMDL